MRSSYCVYYIGHTTIDSLYYVTTFILSIYGMGWNRPSQSPALRSDAMRMAENFIQYVGRGTEVRTPS